MAAEITGKGVEFDNISDEEIVLLSKEGSVGATDFLLEKYSGAVRRIARTYFLVGAGYDDIVQEGMIGLFKAIRDYKTDAQASFRTFAEMCVNRQIITAIKTATRKKHLPLNTYISFDTPLDGDGDVTLADILCAAGNGINPEDIIIDKQTSLNLKQGIEKTLSSLECTVLRLYLEGRSYADISSVLGKDTKAIDNALQRIKRKIERHLNDAGIAQW